MIRRHLRRIGLFLFVRQFAGKAEFVEADLMFAEQMEATLRGVSAVVQLISTSSPGIGNESGIADLNQNVLLHVEFLLQTLSLHFLVAGQLLVARRQARAHVQHEALPDLEPAAQAQRDAAWEQLCRRLDRELTAVVEDVAAAYARAEELGYELVEAPHARAGKGFRAVLRDPDGVVGVEQHVQEVVGIAGIADPAEQREIVLAALETHRWHVTRTAEALGLSDHSSLLKIMRRHGLSKGTQRGT